MGVAVATVAVKAVVAMAAMAAMAALAVGAMVEVMVVVAMVAVMVLVAMAPAAEVGMGPAVALGEKVVDGRRQHANAPSCRSHHCASPSPGPMCMPGTCWLWG